MRTDAKVHSDSARGIKLPQFIGNIRGGKFSPSILNSLTTSILDYERIKDKSHLTPAEKRRLNEIERKLTKVKLNKQATNFVKKHKLLLISAGAGLALSAGSMLGLKHSDPLAAGSLLAFPIGYGTYEGRLFNQIEQKEYDQLTTKFPHLTDKERTELAMRLTKKRIYGGKSNQSYLFYHKGEVYRYDA